MIYRLTNKVSIAAILLIIFIIISGFFNNKVFAEKLIDEPNIGSEAAILIDEKTGRVLYEKHANQRMNPASLTKIATAIYAIEKGKLDDIVTVSKHAREVDGTRVYLEVGEKVPLRKLIQGLLINSGNDAAIAIAEHLEGTEGNFARKLNTYLKEVGVQNTNFVNPHGLYSRNHKTTASDLSKITQYAMKNEVFREIFATKELKWDGESWDTTIYSHHKLMREIPYEGITGGKTGYVNQSGITLITTATRGELSVIAVTLKAVNEESAYEDTITLLDYAFANFKVNNINKGEIYNINNNQYKTDETLNYTISKNEEIKKEISKEGLLEIRNLDQELIASFQLKKVVEQREKGEIYKEIETESNKDNNSIKYILSGLCIFLFCIFYFSTATKYISIFRK